jgi:hypothetical protein
MNIYQNIVPLHRKNHMVLARTKRVSIIINKVKGYEKN